MPPTNNQPSALYANRPRSGHVRSQSFGTESSYEIVPFKSQGSPQVNLPCYITRPYTTRNPDFQGRGDVLELIDKALLPNSFPRPTTSTDQNGLKVFTLHGLGGVGKTQIAVEYMLSRKEHYDAVFWLQADEVEKLESGFSQIALQLGLEIKERSDDPLVIKNLVKAWLAEPLQPNSLFETNKLAKWLLIFDGADNPDQLHDFWPQDGRGSVLITSRDPFARTNFHFGEIGIELGRLPVDDAASLLRKLIQREELDSVSEQLSVDIAHKLDCFPLAILQMAGVIRRRNLSLTEFLDIYNQEVERAELHQLKVGGTQQGYALTLETVWAFEELGPGAFSLLSVISLLDTDCIQEEILTSEISEDILDGFPQSKAAYLRDLAGLTQSSLVHRDPDQNELSVQKVVQDVVRSQLRQSEERFGEIFETTAKLLCNVWPFISKDQLKYPAAGKVARWSQCDKILPHISRLRRTFMSLDEGEKQKSATSTVAWLFAEAAL
jgi:hypothetical protein